MDYYDLLEYLDLEEPSQFIYFEAMADLAEYDNDIDQEAVFGLFSGAEEGMVAELLDDYFEDVLDGLPEDSSEIYDLLHQIKLSLMGMAMNAADEGDVRRLTDGFCRFRRWYTFESDVELTPEEDGEILHHCLRDAITAARVEKLGGPVYRYDFTGAMDYPLDSYEVSLAALVAADQGYNEDEFNEHLH